MDYIKERGVRMFEIGELIIYGNTGVCEVMGVTKPQMAGVSDERLYYELKPRFQRESRIMTPVENSKVPMRRILNKTEAMQLINDMPNIDALRIESDKIREATYKECIRSGDCVQWIRIIKTLYDRRLERQRQGKRMTATDERYLRQAEDYLYSELSIPLDMPRENVESFITETINKASA